MNARQLITLLAILFLSSSCSILKDASQAARESRQERIDGKAAMKAHTDSLVNAGTLERGFSMARTRKAYGNPDSSTLPCKVPVQGSLHLLTQWVYADRGEYVYFLDGRLERVTPMINNNKTGNQ